VSGANPRDEAERLVAAALAAVSVAARSTTGFATGSAECCVCPLCKAIAAVRDPDPQFAERLASGVGDLATGLAGVLRAFATAAAKSAEEPGGTGSPDANRPDASSAAGGDADVWHSATTGTAPAQRPKKPMAKKAVRPAMRNDSADDGAEA
jgi:hypothetical protein